MVPRPHKRRRDGDDAETGDDEETVDLGAAEHAWWAQRPTEQAWTPRSTPPADEAPPRDILADHFGTDWRTSFGFDPPPPPATPEPAPGVSEPAPDPPDPGPAPEPAADDDPYAVLGVTEAASWEEIVTAHRTLARAHHPDLVAQHPEAERAQAEDRIRQINIAYQHLRIRRAR